MVFMTCSILAGEHNVTYSLHWLVYAGGALLVGLRFFWHVVFKLDRYDLQYHRVDILASFMAGMIIWPLLLIGPEFLISPSKLLDTDGYGLAARMRERDRLRKSPPPCGSAIRYHEEDGPYEMMYGEFLFRAVDIERRLRERIRQWPHLANNDEGGMLNWALGRDEIMTRPTDVPSVWRRRFELLADDLVRAGEAKVRCLKCETSFTTDQILTDGPQLTCPQGHPLLFVEHIII